jgi:hypothetical protein
VGGLAALELGDHARVALAVGDVLGHADEFLARRGVVAVPQGHGVETRAREHGLDEDEEEELVAGIVAAGDGGGEGAAGVSAAGGAESAARRARSEEGADKWGGSRNRIPTEEKLPISVETEIAICPSDTKTHLSMTMMDLILLRMAAAMATSTSMTELSSAQLGKARSGQRSYHRPTALVRGD